MSIRYALRENKLLDEPRASRAVVISMETVNLDGVIDRMAAAGSTFGRPEIRAVLDLLATTLGQLLVSGRRIDRKSVV